MAARTVGSVVVDVVLALAPGAVRWDGVRRVVNDGGVYRVNPQHPDRDLEERPVAWSWLDGGTA